MDKEKKKEIIGYVVSTLTIYGFSFVFSLFSLIFLIDRLQKIKALVIIISFVFIAPIFYITYVQGRSCGEKLFRKYFKTNLSDIHNEQAVSLPYYKCIFHVIGFVVPMIIVLIVSVITRSTIVRLVAMIFEFPAALLFSAMGLLNTAVVTPATLAIFLPYTLLLAGIFVLGYLLKLYRLKRQHADIQGEIRMFDN